MTFTRSWSNDSPTDRDGIKYGARDIRQFREDVYQRLPSTSVYSISRFSDLNAAVSNIGSDPALLIIDEPTTVTTGSTLEILETLTLLITGSGSIDGIAGGDVETLTLTNCLVISLTSTPFGSNLTVEGTPKLSYHEFNSSKLTTRLYTTQTTDATETALATIPLTDNKLYSITATVLMQHASATERALYSFQGLFYAAAGSAAQQGTTMVLITAIESDASLDCAFAVDSANVLLNVTGLAANTLNWTAEIKILER